MMSRWFIFTVLVMPLVIIVSLAAYAIHSAAPPHEAMDVTTALHPGWNGQTAVPGPECTK